MSRTTSVRLDDDLKKKLDDVSLQTHRPKNWIINKALQEFFERYANLQRIEKAKQQCLIANQQDIDPSRNDWEALGDELWENESLT